MSLIPSGIADELEAALARAHQPRRPTWTCTHASCGEPWPCATAQADLLIDYANSRLALRMYLSMQLGDAHSDLCSCRTPEEIWRQFFGWLPPVGPA